MADPVLAQVRDGVEVRADAAQRRREEGDEAMPPELRHARDRGVDVLDVVEHFAGRDQVEAAGLVAPGLAEDVAGGELGPWQALARALDRLGADVDAMDLVAEPRQELRLVALAAAQFQQRPHPADVALDQPVGALETGLLAGRVHVPGVRHLVGEVEALIVVGAADAAHGVLHPRAPRGLLQESPEVHQRAFEFGGTGPRRHRRAPDDGCSRFRPPHGAAPAHGPGGSLVLVALAADSPPAKLPDQGCP